MSSIDNRIVEMQFDNRQFEQGVQTSIKSLDMLKKGLDLDKSAKSLAGLEQAGRHFSLAGIANNVEHVASKFSAMGIVGVTAMQRIANSAIDTGKRIVSALTIDPVTTGFNEYELKMDSIRTIMASTGESLKVVNQYLNELNKYSDDTIYSFSDMTQNIGKFTNAGVSLKDAVAAIQGVSNVAAVSGANANEASRAMYNFAQALSAGYVKLIDWKSIELANMGTQEFKNQLIETAVEVGTLTKAQDGMYKTQKGKLLNATQNFNESLTDQWMTTDVLIKTLGNYADETTEIGKKAKTAATEVSTLSKMWDALREAAQSGWAETWENILGDKNEATKLLTDVNNAISEILSKSAEARNELLAEWKQAGGRDDLIKGLTDTFKALGNIAKTVKMAFRDIFPPQTADDLLTMSRGVKEFGANLRKVFSLIEITQYKPAKIAEKVKEAFSLEPLEKVLKRGAKGELVKKLQERLKGLGFDPGDIDGLFGPKTQAALKAFQKKYDLLVDGIYGKESHKKLSELLGIDESDPKLEYITDTITRLSQTLEMLKRIFSGIFSVVKAGLNVLGSLWDCFMSILDALSPLGDLFFQLSAALGDWLTWLFKVNDESGKMISWAEKLKEFLAPLKVALEDLAPALKDFYEKAKAYLGDKLQAAISWFGTLEEKLTPLKETFDSVKQSLKDFYEKVKAYLGDKLQKALEWFGTLKEKLVPLNEAFDGVKQSIKDFYEKAKAYLGDKLETAISWFDTLGEKLAPLKETFDGVKQSIKDFYEKAKAYLGDKLETAISWFDTLGEKLTPLKETFDAVKKAVKDFYEKVKAYLGDKPQKAFDWLGTLKEMLAPLKQTFEGVKRSVKDFYEKVKLYLGDKLSKLPSWVETLKSKFPKIISSIGSFFFSIGKFIAPVVQRIPDFIGRIRDFFVGLYEQAKNSENFQKNLANVKAFLGDFANVVKAFFFGIIEAVKGFFSGGEGDEKAVEENLANHFYVFAKIGEWLQNGWKAVSEAFKWLSSRIGEGLKSGWDALCTVFEQVLGSAERLIGIIAAIQGILTLRAINKLIRSRSTEALSESMLRIAKAIGLIAGAIYFVGNMDPGKLKQGAMVVGIISGILGLVAALSAMLSKKGLGSGMEEMSKSVWDMAKSLGVIALTIYALGGMSADRLLKGGAVLSIILTTLWGYSKLMGKFEGINVNLKGFVGLSVAIGLLAIIARLLGGMDTQVLWRGIGALTAVMGALAMFTTLVNRVGGNSTVKYSGLLVLSLAIGTLAGIAALLGHMNQAQFTRGVLGLISVVALLGVFTAGVNKLSGKSTIKYSGILSLSVAIGILAGMAIMLGRVPTETLSKGVFALLGIMAGLAGLVASLGTFGKNLNVGSSLSMMLGLAAVIWTFGLVMEAIKDVDPKVMLSFAGSLAIALTALVSACMIIGKAKGGVSTLSKGAAGIAAAIGILISSAAIILTALGGIDKLTNGGFIDTLERGGETLKTISDAIKNIDGAIAIALGVLTVGGLAVGATDHAADIDKGAAALSLAISIFITAATGIITALGKIDEVNEGEFVDTLKRGGEVLKTLGESIKSLDGDVWIAIGGLTALSWIVGMTGTGLALLGGSAMLSIAMGTLVAAAAGITAALGKIDEINEGEFVDLLIRGGKVLQAMGAAIGSFAQGVKDGFTGESDMDLYSENVKAYGKALKEFANATDGITEQSVEGGINASKLISEFSDQLQKIGGVAGWFEGEQDLGKFSTDLKAFGEALSSFKASVGTVAENEKVEADTKKAIVIAETVKGFFDDIQRHTVSLGGIEAYNTAASSLAADILAFAQAMGVFCDNVAGLGDDTTIKTDTDVAISIAATVKGFFDSFSVNKISEDNRTGIGKYTDTVKGLFSHIDQFAATINNFATKLQGLGGSKVENNTKAAIGAAQAVADFLDGLEGVDIETNKGAIDKYFTGDTKQNTIFDNISTLSESIKKACDNLKGISVGTFEADVGAMEQVLRKIVGLLVWISNDVKVEDSVTDIGGLSNTFETVMEQLRLLSATISAFDNDTDGVDTERLNALLQPLQDILQTVADLAETNEIENLKTLLNDLKSLFSSEGKNAIDTDSFVSGLDGDAVAQAITDFVAKVGPALQTGSQTLSGYKDSFNQAGEDMVGSLTSGFRAGETDTSGVKAVCGALVSTASGYKGKFETVGKNLTYGLAAGIKNSSAVQAVVSAARKVVTDAIAAAKQASEQNSPSKKFAEIGKGFDEGLVVGIKSLSRVVAKSAGAVADTAINAARNPLANLSSLIDDDIAADPVIRPVVDLSNVSAGARAINGMLSTRNTVSVDSARSRNLAGTISQDRSVSHKPHDYSKGNQYDNSNSGNTNINVDKLVTQNEDDVRLLALELSRHNRRLQFGYGG